ncbi:MAG TPA: tetratricopeptide repeat protein [Polyangiaceae bacterium]|nr:tetratricopeptide repeat protein [Polyangiaceae bacterium]
MTIARGVLGLELYEAVEVGPVEVTELAATLPNLRFPVDLSGGVRPFRHRRGRLERLTFRLSFEAASRHATRRVKEILGGLERPVSVFRVPGGIGVGAIGAQGAVAFDLLYAPSMGDARVVVARARGAGLRGPALGVALAIVDSVFGRALTRSGRVLTLAGAAGALSRLVMPAVGARAPSADGLAAGPVETDGEAVTCTFDTTFPPTALPDDVIRAVELAELVRAADDDLAAGRTDAARQGYVLALERAPRHPELCRLVAEIDTFAGERAEAALSLLSESLPLSESGTIGATLLARVGDRAGAREAIAAATRSEEYAPLAALLFLEAASHADDAASRIAWLSDAVARAPSLAAPRWQRFEARLSHGDVKDALSDAEHLEAAAVGNRARHEVCVRAGRALVSSGYVAVGGRLFERALRYLPDDPEATAGLGRALVESGRAERAVTLLERALALGEKKGNVPAGALVDLAKILAKLGDLPQAVARVRAVASDREEVVVARALEAEWREKLGDLAGASLAYARLRESLELSSPADPLEAALVLERAARFEWESQRDVRAAERHLATALRLAPRDRRIGDAYREMAARLAAELRPASREGQD